MVPGGAPEAAGLIGLRPVVPMGRPVLDHAMLAGAPGIGGALPPDGNPSRMVLVVTGMSFLHVLQVLVPFCGLSGRMRQAV